MKSKEVERTRDYITQVLNTAASRCQRSGLPAREILNVRLNSLTQSLAVEIGLILTAQPDRKATPAEIEAAGKPFLDEINNLVERYLNGG